MLLTSCVTSSTFSGCATTEYMDVDRVLPPFFHAKNVYVTPEGRHAIPRKVLVLPCYGLSTPNTMRDLNGVLAQELTKINVFEVVFPPKEKSMNLRTQQQLSMEESLAWAQAAGADGILMCRITTCQPFRPLSLGMVLRLWSIPRQSVVWGVEETLDSQLTLVANGARNYYLNNFRASYPSRRSEQILESPNMFFQYVFAELFSTFPSINPPPPEIPPIVEAEILTPDIPATPGGKIPYQAPSKGSAPKK